jgi:hypothetical protein
MLAERACGCERSYLGARRRWRPCYRFSLAANERATDHPTLPEPEPSNPLADDMDAVLESQPGVDPGRAVDALRLTVDHADPLAQLPVGDLVPAGLVLDSWRYCFRDHTS